MYLSWLPWKNRVFLWVFYVCEWDGSWLKWFLLPVSSLCRRQKFSRWSVPCLICVPVLFPPQVRAALRWARLCYRVGFILVFWFSTLGSVAAIGSGNPTQVFCFCPGPDPGVVVTVRVRVASNTRFGLHAYNSRIFLPLSTFVRLLSLQSLRFKFF
jgi:hypothetical protein